MLMRQAIVCSPGSRALKDNELISSSDGVDDGLARALCQWSPGRSGFALGQKQSLNFFQPDENTYAISRSAGGLGNDQVEGRRVISKIVLFSADQLNGYGNNVAILFHVLHSAGLMMLSTSSPSKLPMLEIPDRGFEALAEFSRSEFSGETERLVHAVAMHRRVVVLGLKNPLSFMCGFLSRVPEPAKLEFSFATGLKVDDDRQFTLQFFPESEPDLIKELAARQIRTISLDSNPILLY